MAITKTTQLKDVTVLVRDTTDSSKTVLCLTLIDTYDDPNDDQLPLVKARKVNIKSSVTNITDYPQLVQDIAAVAWN